MRPEKREHREPAREGGFGWLRCRCSYSPSDLHSSQDNQTANGVPYAHWPKACSSRSRSLVHTLSSQLRAAGLSVRTQGSSCSHQHRRLLCCGRKHVQLPPHPTRCDCLMPSSSTLLCKSRGSKHTIESRRTISPVHHRTPTFLCSPPNGYALDSCLETWTMKRYTWWHRRCAAGQRGCC